MIFMMVFTYILQINTHVPRKSVCTGHTTVPAFCSLENTSMHTSLKIYILLNSYDAALSYPIRNTEYFVYSEYKFI